MSGLPDNRPIEPGGAPPGEAPRPAPPRSPKMDGGYLVGRLLVGTGLAVVVGGVVLSWFGIVPTLVGPMLVVIGLSDAALGWFLMKQAAKPQ